MPGLGVFFGAVVGFSLGLTGGGGSIFAVPLLVYGLSVPPKEAVGISLSAVGATSLVGFFLRLRLGDISLKTGFLFAFFGMLGAPLGSFFGVGIPDIVLLSLFSVLMLLVAFRMWTEATKDPERVSKVRALLGQGDEVLDPVCRRGEKGSLELTFRCAVVLSLVGFAAGGLSGVFGVGGGFVIVPALVFFAGMEIRRAVATSLLVISLVSLSGVVGYVARGGMFDLSLAFPFAAGGIAGLLIGVRFARRLSGPGLQKVFAVSIVLVAGFTISKTLFF